MAYTPADATSFQARFPAFADVDDNIIEDALDRARRVVDSTWLADDRQEAESLHAAHELTMDGLGETREVQLQGFDSLKLGSLSLSLKDNKHIGPNSSGYAETSFGRRFLSILKRNKPGVIALGGS